MPLLALAACKSGSSSSTSSSATTAALTGEETASSAALGDSDAAYGPMFGGGPMAGGPGAPGCGGQGGCAPTVLVLSTSSVCGHAVPTSVQVTWACDFPNGDSITGTDVVNTTVTPDACPPTQVAIAQQINLDQTRVHGDLTSHATGTSTASWTMLAPPPMGTPAPGSTPPPLPPPPADRSMSLDVHVADSAAGTPVHDAHVTGSRTSHFDDAGTPGDPSDDAMVDNGQGEIDDTVTDAKVTAADTNIKHVISCCWPVAGTSTHTFGSLSDPTAPTETHTLTFGPACGAADDNGQSVTLPACMGGPGPGGMGPGGNGPGGNGP
ncbi:MAG TPA: hypothetical protein VMV18_15335 [bacterium]|nr:hypothetical protein [bacterium]